MANGDSKQAKMHTMAALAAAERLRDRERLSTACCLNQGLAQAEGDWEAARAFCDRALGFWQDDTRVLASRTLLEYEVGNLDQGGAYLERSLDVMRLTPRWINEGYGLLPKLIPLIALITGDKRLFDEAEKAAKAILSSPSATPRGAQGARVGLALMAVQRGDADAASEQYAFLEPSRGTNEGTGTASLDRVLGLLAQTMGNLDIAAGHFEDALAFCRKAGYRPTLAWSCYDYANMLIQTIGAHSRAPLRDAREKAIALLDEALAISTTLGMKPLMEKAASLREGVAARPASAPKYPANLTERQVQVLLLIAEGKTSREIADLLFLSGRTVNRHVADIYNKIGARNRAEATAFALNELAPFRQTPP